MLVVLSPSKTLDETSPLPKTEFTQPVLLNHTKELAKQLKVISEKDLAKLMGISPKLATLNARRYQNFSTPFTAQNARSAWFTFKGDVYAGIPAQEYSEEDLAFAQAHVRILSGLYGLLRPLDLMQPYRLEMGTVLKNANGKDLYAFWGDSITETINEAMREANTDTLINLASNEYFHAVRPKALKGKILTVQFKERRGNKLQIIGLFAKKARGRMADYIVQKRLTDPQALKKYTWDNYAYEPDLSEADIFVFVR